MSSNRPENRSICRGSGDSVRDRGMPLSAILGPLHRSAQEGELHALVPHLRSTRTAPSGTDDACARAQDVRALRGRAFPRSDAVIECGAASHRWLGPRRNQPVLLPEHLQEVVLPGTQPRAPPARAATARATTRTIRRAHAEAERQGERRPWPTARYNARRRSGSSPRRREPLASCGPF